MDASTRKVIVTSQVEQLAQKATGRPYSSIPCDCFRAPTAPLLFLASVVDRNDPREATFRSILPEESRGSPWSQDLAEGERRSAAPAAAGYGCFRSISR